MNPTNLPLKITDTTLRDAHQSLIATRMRTEDMLPLAESIDKVGFFSVEAWGGATFDTCIRFLNEDPWKRLQALDEVLKKTPIQMLLRGQNLVGYRHYSDDVVDRFVERSYENGVDIFRVFDALNDIRNMDRSMRGVKKAGAHLQAAISYTTSPVHSVQGFVKMAEELAAYECDSICIKDMAGLIMPNDAQELITGIKEQTGMPVDLHCHSTSGIASMSYQAAIEAGVDILDTAMSPFALGTSQPPTESIIASVMGTPRDTGISLESLQEVRDQAVIVREKYEGLFTPVAERVDSNVLVYQLPGGMITNLVSQLAEQDALDKLSAVYKEIPRVREELGYPPLVTPSSQIVGTQAVFNVLSGERYKNITKEVRDYVRGLYGKAPGQISEEIIKKIVGEDEIITVRPADVLEPMYEIMEMEAKEAGFATSVDDILTYIMYPAIAPSFLKGERVAEEIPSVSQRKGSSSLELPGVMEVEVDGEVFSVRIVSVEGKAATSAPSDAPPRGDIPGGVKSNMQGIVLELKVDRGDSVKEGDVLLVLEAMKMENPIHSPRSGTIIDIYVDSGDTVQSGDVLMIIE
ncbi:MAG: sodium-extruding oxaloacetate decarboxylase subunit alpha [Methanomicrobiales archaeon]|nr:sodium-extruding oxaloacetate decarboxylase subunit alpha [Methanomicrobiales archaeon]